MNFPYLSVKIKSAATEATAQKMQAPIVAKLSQYKSISAIMLMEFAFLSNSQQNCKKGIVTPKDNAPKNHILLV